MYHAIVGKANKKEPTTGLAETYATALCGRATFHLSQVMANGRRLGIRVEELFFCSAQTHDIFFYFPNRFYRFAYGQMQGSDSDPGRCGAPRDCVSLILAVVVAFFVLLFHRFLTMADKGRNGCLAGFSPLQEEWRGKKQQHLLEWAAGRERKLKICSRFSMIVIENLIAF